MTRHEFLAALHELLKPSTYLEIGVQNGLSLSLAGPNTRAIAVDPHPAVCVPIAAHTHMQHMTSDEFFAREDPLLHLGNRVDFAFIDGMHLAEYALRDFMNVGAYAHHRTVVAFDDVLPRNQQEASRTSNPGDWAGDVWRVTGLIRQWWPSFKLALVNTQPTGILLVTGFAGAPFRPGMRDINIDIPTDVDQPVPEDVLNRDEAYAPQAALEWLASVHGLERQS